MLSQLRSWSAGSGREMYYPCTESQPSRRRYSNSASVSTPSATTCSSRASQLQRRVGDRLPGAILHQVRDEAFVDLHFLDGEVRLRFRATHLPAVRDGSKRLTMRFRDPVHVGPALLVFESDDEVSLAGHITSTTAKSVGSITNDEARDDGFASAADVLPGLRDYYPDLQASDEIVIVRFEVNG
jgi:hypothetical protein